MKRIAVCAAFACAVILCLCAGGCFVAGRYVYDNAAQYSVGAFELEGEAVSSLRLIEIDWISGSVEIVRDREGQSLSVDESGVSGEDHALRYEVRGETLRIKFMKSGMFSDRVGGKQLRCSLPYELLVERVHVSCVSADISVEGVPADYFDLESVSGDVTASRLGSSGLEIETVSGAITVTGGTHRDLSLESVSGDVRVEDITATGSLDVETVSGKVSFSAPFPEGGIEVSTVSGKVSLALNEDASFRMTFDSVSGDLFDSFGVRQNGKEYLAGDGLGHIHVDTTSGDLSLSLYGEA